MARNILTQFRVLAGNSTGWYSLGESDKENFTTPPEPIYLGARLVRADEAALVDRAIACAPLP